MSAYGVMVTVLATQLAEAVLKDEAPAEGGFDLSAGMFGRHVSDWIRAVAQELDSKPAARAIEKIKEAVSKNNEMQGETDAGSVEWHAHETIDDLLFDALAALGELK